MIYPGEFIPTILLVRNDGTRLYVSAKDHYKATREAPHFIDRSVPSFFRPKVNGEWPKEICRKYRSVPVGPYGKTAKAFQDMYGRVKGVNNLRHYTLEEIHE